MKNKVMWMVIGWLLVSSLVWPVSAYNIWSPIQFVKQLFVTPTGSSDASKATIKLDGTNGRIDAKSIYENRVQVATKSDLNSYATKSDLNSYATKSALKNYATTSELSSYASKSYVDTHNQANSSVSFASVCNADNIGKHNLNGRTCISLHVTNDYHCINSLEDGVKRYAYNSKLRCKDGHKRILRWMCLNGKRTCWVEGSYVGRYFVYEFGM